MTLPASPAREPVPDQLRGMAAMMVAAFHCALPFYDQLHALLPGPLFAALFAVCNGSAGVALFFVLSGYVLQPALDRLRGQSLAPLRFVLRRVFRILPGWWASVLIGLLLAWASRGTRLPGDLGGMPQDGLLHRTVQNALLTGVDLNPVGWTLQIELAAVPLIYLFWRLCRRPAVALAGVALAVWALYHLLLAPLLPGVYPAQFAFMFMLGAMLHDGLPWLRRRLTPSQLAGLGWLLIPLGLALWLLPSSKPLFQLRPGYFLLCGLGAASLLLGTLLHPLPRGRFGNWLEGVGLVSFSFYLLHRLLLTALAVCLLAAWPALAGQALACAAVFALLSFPLALGLARPLYHYLERPMIRLGRLVERRLGQNAAPLPAQALGTERYD